MMSGFLGQGRCGVAALGTGVALLGGAVWARNQRSRRTCHAEGAGFPELTHHIPRMVIKQPDEFVQKCMKIRAGGANQLLLISDFDYTLTKYYHQGKRGMSCHGLLPESNLLPESFNKAARELYLKYFPIEISPTLSTNEKLPYMVEWWTKSHELLVSQHLTLQMLQKAVAEADIQFRPGFDELFETIKACEVPVLIFSAGLSNIIRELIHVRAPHLLSKDLHIVSNLMKFDESGKLIGFDGELLHGHNKDARVLVGSAFLKQCEERSNVLLIGDTLQDGDMANGIDYETIIRIGFLNDHIDERMEDYLDKFDVVITGDSSLSAVQFIFDFVTDHAPTQ